METSQPSPFNYEQNTLRHISNAVSFPNQQDKDYLRSVADEVERLVQASHGHAAVLFTSYNAMGQVFALLKERGLPYPMFQMVRRDTAAMEKFKTSGNGILFASGALWEGIDIPGDALSMLIIVKLPFAVPDPIGDYELTLYSDMDAYKNQALVPDMRSVDPAALVDIRDVSVNTDLPRDARMQDYLDQIKNPYYFKCGKTIVKVSFADTGATIAKHYFK